VLDRVLLVFERLGFLADVLGERIERRHTLLGRLAHLLQLGERAEFLLDVLHDLHRRVGLVVRLARELFQPAVILRELPGKRAQLVEVSLQAVGSLG
jgi:hypothetical protein